MADKQSTVNNFGVNHDTSVFTKSMTTFSGADIALYVNGRWMSTAQSVSYSITREKAPVYVLGSASPVAFSRGKRGIGGSLIFSSVSTDALGEFVNGSKFYSKSTDLAYYMEAKKTESKTGEFTPGIQTLSGYLKDEQVKYGYRGLYDDSKEIMIKQVEPVYYDQILPFNIVIMGANEYGALAQMVIYGVELLTSNSGLSVDDTTNETQMTFAALHITRWTPVHQKSDSSTRFYNGTVGFNPATGFHSKS